MPAPDVGMSDPNLEQLTAGRRDGGMAGPISADGMDWQDWGNGMDPNQFNTAAAAIYGQQALRNLGYNGPATVTAMERDPNFGGEGPEYRSAGNSVSPELQQWLQQNGYTIRGASKNNGDTGTNYGGIFDSSGKLLGQSGLDWTNKKTTMDYVTLGALAGMGGAALAGAGAGGGAASGLGEGAGVAEGAGGASELGGGTFANMAGAGSEGVGEGALAGFGESNPGMYEALSGGAGAGGSGAGGGLFSKLGGLFQGGGGRVLSGLADLYTSNKNKKGYQQLLGQNDDSAYQTQLRKELMRRDAAAGRRSDYGSREVELQAKLADLRARRMPGQLAAMQGMNGANTGMAKDFLQIGSEVPWDKVGGWLGGLFGG